MGALHVLVGSNGLPLCAFAVAALGVGLWLTLAVGVALFHPDHERREAALHVLDRLLTAIRPGRR